MKKLLNILGGLLLLAGQALAAVPTTLGWHEITATLQSVCPPNDPDYNFNDFCDGVVNAWSSGALDTKRNRLIIHGGGHTDYEGNEIYALNPELGTLTRLNDPTVPTASSCVDGLAGDTVPNSRHTFDGMAYMENIDALYVHGGSLACGNGNEADGNIVWIYKFGTATWERKVPTVVGSSPDQAGNGKTAAYDPYTQTVFWHNREFLFQFDYAANTLTERSNDLPILPDPEHTAIVDPDHHYYVLIGQGEVATFDITPGGAFTGTSRTTSGDQTCQNKGGPGLAWDSLNHRIVCYGGGNTIYFLNTSTWAWTSVTHSGGPPSWTCCSGSTDSYTYKRFGYVPSKGYYVFYPADFSQNGWALRLDAFDADTNFTTRCTAPGVVKCEDFNDAGDFVTNTTVFAGDDSQVRCVRDTSVYASGGGAVKCTIPAGEWTSDPTGYYKVAIGTDFGEGNDLYFQFRQRFTANYITDATGPSAGFKSFILWHGSGNSCTDVQFVQQNIEQRTWPRWYTACGGTRTPPSGVQVTHGDGDVALQFGLVDGTAGGDGYWCTNRNDDPGETDCAFYTANQWITYDFHIRVGTWGSGNSLVRGWATYPNGVRRILLNHATFQFDNDTPASKKFRQLDLVTYHSNCGGGNPNCTTSDSQAASTWFDEVIVSTNPISPAITAAAAGAGTPREAASSRSGVATPRTPSSGRGAVTTPRTPVE